MSTQIGIRFVARSLPALGAALMVLLLAVACDGTSMPQVIASHPREDAEPQLSVPTEGRFELTVRNAARAMDDVAHLAVEHDGIVMDEAEWRSSHGRNGSMTVIIPVANLGSFLRGLRTVGTVLTDQLVIDGDQSVTNTHLRIILHEPIVSEPQTWNPARTFGTALSVFLHLFQVVVDGLIWIVVVAGPFVLMGIGLFVVLRRARQARP